MDAVLLSRLQFAITIMFHFIFAPLTIGLAWLIFSMMTRYRRTGGAEEHDTARFWLNIFALSFAVGVATGITMEFQFGTNWAFYSRFVGDIFGAPLAAETITSFFLESVFIGLLLFGWDRVSRNVLWFASLMVAVGATLSAFWILVANSWMQTPAGYHYNPLTHRAELSNFWQALWNPSVLPRLLHTVDGAVVTGAYFMLGISAWLLLKGRQNTAVKSSFSLALIVAFIFSVAQLYTGDISAVQVAHTQPEKLASIEGLFTSRRHAPLLLFGIPDAQIERTRFAIRVPGLLSLLATGHLDGEVKGLKSFPKSDWPPLLLTFAPFHLMFLIGLFLILFPGVGCVLLWRQQLYRSRWYLLPPALTIPLPFIANELGWMTAEVGRQPWIVYHLLRTHDAISVSVPAAQIHASLVMFTVIYGILFVLWLLYVRRAVEGGLADK